MNSISRPSRPLLWLLLLSAAATLSSCDVLRTATFDQYSYERNIDIKVEATNLMEKAVTPYSDHQEEVESLLLEAEKLKIYEQNKEDNSISAQMWELLTDPERNSLAGFFKRWKEKGTLDPNFIEEASRQVNEGLDALIKYEGSKNREGLNNLQQVINAYTQ